MIPRNLPTYVEDGGRRQVWRQPYRAQGATLLGLVLPAEPTKIDQLLDRDFNHPSGGAVRYRCAHPYALVVLARIEQERSAEPPDSGRGYLPELELSIWCLAFDQTAGGRLVWYLPYVFTDSGQTVTTGREVYGYPKQLGHFGTDFPSVFTDQGGKTAIESLAIEKFAPDAKAELKPMVTVHRATGAPVPEDGDLAARARHNLFPGALSDPPEREIVPDGSGNASATITVGTAPPPPPAAPPPYVRPPLRWDEPISRRADHDLIVELAKSPTLAFLKQFRDAGCPTRACYQAVVEATISIRPLGAGITTLDPKLFDVSVQSWDTQPIAAELGVPRDQALQPTRAFLATLDFDVMTGLEVWRAPT